MGKLTEFAILFDHNREVFYPGQNVSGCVVMTLSSPMEMRGIKLLAQGKGECHWSETTGTGDNRHTHHYHGSEKLFEFQVWIHGNSIKFTNEAGRFFFPFNFILSPVLPSSFEGLHGHIRYQIFAEIDKPWKFNHKTTRAFTINEVIDTNLPNYNTVLSGSTHKEVGCCCCAAGPLDLTASIDRSAYCPGEIILITAEAGNSTTRDMTGMKAQLYKHIEYIANHGRKRCSEKVAAIQGPPIPKGESASWQNQPFLIPAACPTILTSSVIKVWYELCVEIDVSWGFDPTIRMQIIMGTVPHFSTYYQPGPNFQPTQFQPNPELQSQTPGGFMGYPQMSQPLYVPMVGATATNIIDGNDTHSFGNLNYIPVYAFNNMQQPQINGLPVSNQISSVVDQQPVNPMLLSQPPPTRYGSTN
ncbi:arrestin domain-containing protein 3 [Hydra vulgaris]|uniref:arrestin domain-containing protein 3 n=1 Tax=Hydra vulgaris TaxID=6087 RepID=UPI001F5E501E|nr:arrestin domain-containing protein 3-like [Hydra vulgaris]XP_047138083.1 arrestin domain-containing protein 3-like [Hydra vulgaris]